MSTPTNAPHPPNTQGHALRRGLIVLLALALTTPALLALLLGWYLSKPALSRIGPPPAGFPAETITLQSPTGTRLSAWFAPGEPERGAAILLLHSLRGNRLTVLDRARFLHEAGYSVLLPDLQAHGESEGGRITFGYRESADAQAALDWLRERLPGRPIGVIGLSLGGASALLGDLHQQVDALVLEAVYTTAEKAIANRLRIRLGAPGAWFAPLFSWQFPILAGVGADWLAPQARIGQSRAPILIIAGGKDQHTTLADSQALYDRAPSPKSIWVLEDAAHLNFHRHAPQEYQHRVLSFFQRYLISESRSATAAHSSR